jgi:predicted metal-dependent phosphoesterase TrpH
VLAHPGQVPHYEALLIECLVPAGLDGIEVVHPDNPPPVEARARELAQQYNLVMTGGSDFHDLAWVEREGKAMIGSVTPPEGCVEALRARAEERGKHI